MAQYNNSADRLGQQVGDYRLLRRLGGGGFGDVYLAEHVRNHAQVAIKVLQARLTHSEELKAFINEARTFRLKHPHIVPLLDFGIATNDVPFLVMEYVPRGTLRERHAMGTVVPLPSVVAYVSQIASALQYAHNQYLIHRDVKPENMLVGTNGEILLTDFGIATVAHNSYTFSKQQYENIGGTVSYMAPEQIEGRPRPASDQYALGVITYEWLSGKRPFQGTTIEVMMQHGVAQPASFYQQIPMLNAEVEQVVFTALAKDPAQRFSSVQAFATALTQASKQSSSDKQVLLPSASPGMFQAAAMTEADSSALRALSSNEQQVPYNTAFSQPWQAPNTGLSETWRPPPPPAFSRDQQDMRSAAAPTPPRHTSFWGRTILLVALAFLILGGGTFAYVSLSNSATKPAPSPTPQAHITPTVATTPTMPNPATDHAGFYTWATSGQPMNTQSFADPTLGWDTNSNCVSSNGNYQVSAQPSPGVVILTSCIAKNTNYTDFALQFDMTMSKGQTAGLIFRSNSVLNAEYLFEVNSNNTYFLNSSNSSLGSQNAIVPTSSFSGKTANTLTVIARGHDIYLYINQQYLTHATDATSGSGQIGLFVDAQPTDQGGAIANFSNLKIWTLA